MNWEAIGTVGQVLDAAIVLITLGYLAVQIRQNTQVMQNSALGAALDFHRLFDRNERYIALLAKSRRKEEFTLNPFDFDSDDDGDGDEIAAGTDPNDPADFSAAPPFPMLGMESVALLTGILGVTLRRAH